MDLLLQTPSENLKKKIKDKKNSRNKNATREVITDDDNIFNMLNQVNQMLKNDPEMVKKVSKCVNSVFENKSLLDSLVKEINTSQVHDLDSSSSSDNPTAKS